MEPGQSGQGQPGDVTVVRRDRPQCPSPRGPLEEATNKVRRMRHDDSRATKRRPILLIGIGPRSRLASSDRS